MYQAEGLREITTPLMGWLKDSYANKEVTLIKGKYSGRAALITDVAIEQGEIVFLCMVSRSGTEPSERDFLNSDAASRSYMLYHEFLVMP